MRKFTVDLCVGTYRYYNLKLKLISIEFVYKQESSAAVEWSLNKATSGIDQIVKYPLPYMIRDPLIAVDQMLCTSLDLTELNIPALTKTPHKVI